jgi:repressor LexA
MTRGQQKVYDFIKAFITQHNYSPSLIEIAQGIGIRSKSLISRYVHALVKADAIELAAGQYRQIRLKVEKAAIPLVGCIAAGRPIEAINNMEQLDIVNLLQEKARLGPYALRVKGDSMIEEGIFDGDIVVCYPRTKASNGEIVVALIDEQEATLKRIKYTANNTITLCPANATLSPIAYSAERVRIQGIYMGLLRFVDGQRH